MKHIVWKSILFIFISFLFWYFMLPPLNLTDPIFWTYLFDIVIIALVIYYFPVNLNFKNIRKISLPKVGIITLSVLIGLFILIEIINLAVSPVFNAKTYANRITVDETQEFTEDVKEVDFNKIPLLDKSSSQKLGDRKMGEATEWVSQFYVSDLYTQINFNDSIIRVTPIEYADIIKYFTNRKEGIKGYITVDSVDGNASLVTLDKGMKYMPSAYFFENLDRYLRVKYPFTIFDDASFEIDNEGNPYWIIPTVKYKGVGMRKEISGVVILNAITGDTKKYALQDIPSWVDHVYSASLIIEQLDNWGEYKNGFLNSIFGQKNVVNTTDGYNYLVMDDDVYLYTGITSVSSDESNLGFVLVNMRTKKTNFYNAPGAEEYSAMASAEGLVQEKNYDASFPLLINLNSRPTYLLSLKDDAGLVKMYAFVDVKDYQKVTVTDASLGIENAAQKYISDYQNDIDSLEIFEKTLTIKEVTSAIIDGNTYYYFVSSEGEYYVSSIKVNSDILPFIKNNATVKVSYTKGSINTIKSLEIIK